MITAQGLAGAAAAIIVPSLVALIAENYHGAQQATAVGSLGSARAASGISAFLIGGILGTFIGWRPVFGILVVLAVIVFILSFRLRSDTKNSSVQIDLVGAVLIGVAIVLITVGFNNLNGWGVLTTTPAAPFTVFGLSPAPVAVVVGVIAGQGFFLWTRRRTTAGRTPLLNLQVIESGTERSAVYALFIIVALEAGINFTVPLYIQIVQGRTPLDTSFAMMPFNLTVFFTALLIVRFYNRFSMRTLACTAFIVCTIALIWLSFVVSNNWETFPTIIGLVVFGIGQGALVTLLFNVLVTSSPKELAGDVGSLRGTTQNLASAVGTALAGAMLVALLSVGVTQGLAGNQALPESLQSQVGLDSVNFVSNKQLTETLAKTDATPEQVKKATDLNANARLNALRTGLLILAGICALAIIPARRLPGYQPEEIPDPSPAEVGGAAGNRA
jgi:MFS family permease